MADLMVSSPVDYSRLETTAFAPARVRDVSVLVVGAGALGNEVVKTLGLLGTGRVTVVDPDIVETSNWTRSVLLRSAPVGRSKAVAVAEAGRCLFPDTEMTPIEAEIADVGFQQIGAANILFGCVDSDLARLELGYIATKLDLPLCDGGLATSNLSRGRVTYYPGRSAACHGCRLTRQRRRELLTIWDSQARPCWDAPEPRPEQAYPSTPVMAGVVAALQVEIGLRRVFGSQADSCAISYEVELSPTPRIEEVRISRNPECPFHSAAGVMIEAPGSASTTTVAALLADAEACDHPGATLLLDWPVCARARCLECGWIWSPLQRLARLRRHGRCPHCGSSHFREQETIERIGPGSPWAALTLAELGLPEHHLHTLWSREGPGA